MQFHLLGRDERHCRSFVSNWVSNLADCHLFWNVVVGTAATVLRAELVGEKLKFVVTTKSGKALLSADGADKESHSTVPALISLEPCALVPNSNVAVPDLAAAVPDPRAKKYTARAAADCVFPWQHVGIHVLSLTLCMWACVTGVAQGLMSKANPGRLATTLWCAHNALPLCLLLLRTLHGDSLLLKHSCWWLPRMYLMSVCVAFGYCCAAAA